MPVLAIAAEVVLLVHRARLVQQSALTFHASPARPTPRAPASWMRQRGPHSRRPHSASCTCTGSSKTGAPLQYE